MRRPLAGLLVVAAAFVLAAARAAGEEPPPETFELVPPVEGIPGPLFYGTPTLRFVPKGTLRVTFGVQLLHGVELPYSGLAGDLAQLGITRLEIGFGRTIEVRIQGAVRQALRIDEDRSDPGPRVDVDGGATRDSGDFSVLTIARILPERGWKPAFGLRVEVKLPNTDERKGIGTNTTDVLLSVPAQKRLGRFLLNSDLGIGILTVPTDAQRQTDTLLYGLAAAWEASQSWTLSGEVNGRWSPPGGEPGTGNRADLRAGVSWSSGSWALGLTFSHGFGEGGEDLGVTLALSYGFRVFDRVRSD